MLVLLDKESTEERYFVFAFPINDVLSYVNSSLYVFIQSKPPLNTYIFVPLCNNIQVGHSQMTQFRISFSDPL